MKEGKDQVDGEKRKQGMGAYRGREEMGGG